MLHNTIHKVSVRYNKHSFICESGSTECWSIQCGLMWAALWVSWEQLIQLGGLGHLGSLTCASHFPPEPGHWLEYCFLVVMAEAPKISIKMQVLLRPLLGTSIPSALPDSFGQSKSHGQTHHCWYQEVYTFHQVRRREHLWTIVHRDKIYFPPNYRIYSCQIPSLSSQSSVSNARILCGLHSF